MKTIQEIMDAVAGLDSLNTAQKIKIVDDIRLVLIDGTSSQKLEHCNQCLIRLSDERDCCYFCFGCRYFRVNDAGSSIGKI